MVLDQDYPIGRRQAQITVLGLVIMAIIGGLLFGGFLPGVHPDFTAPAIATLDGHQYYVEPIVLQVPLPVSTSSSPWNVTFHNVTFTLWLTDWYSGPGGIVHGIGTEPNGTAYPFSLGGYATNGTRITLFLSPDYAFGGAWTGGPFGGVTAQLLVEV